jgi:cell wall-associated NlpC family hydrolase
VSPNFSFAEQMDECDCLKTRAERHRLIGRKYIWGDWDCSKFIYQILTDCGISVQRCTSADYARGRCGFNTEVIERLKRCGCDFAFWTFPGSKRIFGHTGMFSREDRVYHNSAGRKRVVKDQIYEGTYLEKYLERVRRLNPNRGK